MRNIWARPCRIPFHHFLWNWGRALVNLSDCNALRAVDQVQSDRPLTKACCVLFCTFSSCVQGQSPIHSLTLSSPISSFHRCYTHCWISTSICALRTIDATPHSLCYKPHSLEQQSSGSKVCSQSWRWLGPISDSLTLCFCYKLCRPSRLCPSWPLRA